MKTRLLYLGAIVLLAHFLQIRAYADTSNNTAAEKSSIPWDQIGARAGANYRGDGLAVTPGTGSARLHCAFQRLDGTATREGLWLSSTVGHQADEHFRVTADATGRYAANQNQDPTSDIRLSQTGEVSVDGQTVRFIRPGLVEEYSVSVDGVRQDFVVMDKPAGTGELTVHLAVSGASVEATPDGARLVLAQSGRKIAYSRLQATDATGRELPARMEVRDGLIVAVDDTSAVYPVRIDPVFSDANWVSLGGIPGANNTVSAAVVDGSGNLYIGGNFTIIGNMYITNIAEWNGTTWSAVGPLLNGGSVSALAVSGGNLYAGGSFTSAGSTLVIRVAVWNGSSWSALGTGVNNTVFALATSGGNLYAGGYFTIAGGNAVTYVAQWNGSAWSSMGTGVNNAVLSLAVLGTNVVAGGQFSIAGAVHTLGIAEWNGTSWLAMGGGVNSAVNALAVSGTNLFAGGSFTAATNTGPVALVASNIVEWNGSSWSALGLGVNNTVESLLVSGTNLYAGGYFTSAGGAAASLVALWNGSSWSNLGTGVGQVGLAVNALAMMGTNLIVCGGGFSRAGTNGVNNLAQWNGSTWSPVIGGMNNTVSAVAVMGTNIYAGGSFLALGNPAATYIAQWNGNSWSALGPGVNSQVDALAVMGTNLFVGGFFTMAGGNPATNIAEWNGATWSTLGTGISGWLGAAPPVSALAVQSNSNLLLGGEFGSVSGVSATNIAEWNAASGWHPLSFGVGNSPFSSVSAIAIQGGSNVYVGGSFTVANNGAIGVTATNVALWNGSTWSALGLGLGGTPNALAMLGTNLIAGGSFTKAGGNAATNIAEWNGSGWSPLGFGVNNTVYALAVSDTNLYVGGSFSKAGGNPATDLARWDGNNWWPVGSGMNNTVNALLASGNVLLAGGSFTTAGGVISSHVAEAVSDVVSWVSIQSDVPGPKTNTLTYLGFPNNTHVVLYRTNLLTGSWIPLATNIPAADGVGIVQDPAANPQRFYLLKKP